MKKSIVIISILAIIGILIAVIGTSIYLTQNQLSPEDSSAAVRQERSTSQQTKREKTQPASYPEFDKGGNISLSYPVTIGDPQPLFCIEDVYLCPDGSYVTRDPQTGCNFRPCSSGILETY